MVFIWAKNVLLEEVEDVTKSGKCGKRESVDLFSLSVYFFF